MACKQPFQLPVPNDVLGKPFMLEASAGTGKTYSLTRLVLATLLYTDTPPEALLVITFTRNATAELKDRLSQLLRETLLDNNLPSETRARLSRIAADFDTLTITTIDAFFQGLYQNICLETGDNPKVRPSYEDTWLYDVAMDYFRRFAPTLEEDPKLREGLMALLVLVKVKKPGSDRAAYLKKFDDLIPWLVENILTKPLLTSDAISPSKEQFDWAWQQREAFLQSESKLRKAYENLIHSEHPQVWEVLRSPTRAQQATGLTDVVCFMVEGSLTDCCWGKLNKEKNRKDHDELENFYNLLLPLMHNDKQEFPYLAALAAYFLRHFLEQTGILLQEQKEQHNIMRLEDITRILCTELEQNDNPVWLQKARRTYKNVFIDEFQDTNRAQWQILYHIFRPLGNSTHSYALIGDPKQLIYYFRGSAPQTYLQAKQTLEPSQVFVLRCNYRSHALVMAAINFWFSRLFAQHPIYIYQKIQAASPTTMRLVLPQNTKPCGLTFLYTDNVSVPMSATTLKEQCARLCVHFIAQLLHNSDYQLMQEDTQKARPIHTFDIACLVDSYKEAQELKNHLDALHIPNFILNPNSSIYETEEFDDVVVFLKALAQPQDEALRNMVLTSTLVGFTYEQLLSIEKYQKELNDFYEHFYVWQRYANSCRIALVFDELLETYHYYERVLQLPDGDRRFVNMRQLLAILLREERAGGLNSGADFLCNRFKLLRQQQRKEDPAKLRLETDEDAVRITTIHQAKGLEYPIVFGLYGFKTIKTHSDNMLIQYQQKPFLNLGLDATFGAQHCAEELDEELRKFYVMVTRAQSHVFLPLCSFTKNTIYQKVLQQLTGAEQTLNLDLAQAVLNLAQDPASPFGAIECDIAQQPPLYRAATETFETLQAAVLQHSEGFGQRIVHVSSYSSLWQNLHSFDEESDRIDEFDTDIPLEEPEATEALSALNITGGTSLGNAFHAIMEQLPFEEAQSDKELFCASAVVHNLVQSMVARHMNVRYHYQRDFLEVVKHMIWQSLNAPIALLGGMRLADIPRDCKRHEVEFLWHIPTKITLRTPYFLTQVAPGFLRGFLDLVFIHGGRYYVLDWKTTRLGPSIHDYDPKHLAQAMIDHGYDMQARLYLQALCNYLHIPQKEIGGALYLFSRGVDVTYAGYGVYEQSHTEGNALLEPLKSHKAP